ncbi:uncharacterized protein DUF385 [Antricoccus suffuscus]|uniref:Uncharacterized protein DUF385 n=2 Tax=Antricoccus suffuscus TaxID=1629062 RepID=A0A2T1A5P2_9ACTN|nr:uncharacterized protein DUF385 [Antricoccus suffuscus]
MNEGVRRKLAIDSSSTLEDRTIDITTVGRRSGKSRRIEIVFYRFDDDIYLSGIPAPKQRDWLANLSTQPEFVCFTSSTASWRTCLHPRRSSSNQRSGDEFSPH